MFQTLDRMLLIPLLAKSILRLLQRKFSQPLSRLPMKQLREESARWRWWQLVHSGQTLADGWQTSVMELAGSSSTSSCTSTSTSLHPNLPAPQPADAPQPCVLLASSSFCTAYNRACTSINPYSHTKTEEELSVEGQTLINMDLCLFQLQCGFDENEQERVR